MGSRKPSVIDLFCGCGGFSLGAERAGFSVIASADNDEKALTAHQRNFPNSIHIGKDLSSLSGSQIAELAQSKIGDIAGVIGGPPCQGFSCMGKQDKTDVRNLLFTHFFRLVSQLRPQFFVCENVPGILNSDYDDLRRSALQLVEKSYVFLPPMPLIASDYGAPTTRKRVFFIGFLRTLNVSLCCEDFAPPAHIKKITVSDALRGLPTKVNPDWLEEDQGWRKVHKGCNGEYGARLRETIPVGVGHKESIDRLKIGNRVSGCLGTRHTEAVIERYRALKPGETDMISKSRRLEPSGFCPTLRAGTGKDHGRFQAVRPVHPTEPRVITPREAARLQGFPDWFQFDATKWHSFRQIGNSVSPILAEFVMAAILLKLNSAKS